MGLSTYQAEFANFLIASGALSFGEFTLKSGRKAPYYINAGSFNDGNKISALGYFYAQHILQSNLLNNNSKASIIFGPAYKGIPLCVATAFSLAKDFKHNVFFSFDRKEAKEHGDKGTIVGHQLNDGDEVILVEDVISAGTTLRKVIPSIRSLANVSIKGVVVAVDRQERGEGTLSAVAEAKQNLQIDIFPLLTIRQIIEYLSKSNDSGLLLSQQQQQQTSQYLETYGA